MSEGTFYIETTSNEIICEEALGTQQIITFLKNASQEIRRQIVQYSISNDEKKILDAILKTLKS